MSSMEAAKILKMPVSVFGKLTGSFSVDPGRYDLGLNLKHQGSHCVVGYTRKRKENGKKAKDAWEVKDSLLVIGSGGATTAASSGSAGNGFAGNNDDKVTWEYTTSALKLVALYQTNFPQVANHLKKNPNERFYDAKNIFGSGAGTGEEKVSELS